MAVKNNGPRQHDDYLRVHFRRIFSRNSASYLMDFCEKQKMCERFDVIYISIAGRDLFKYRNYFGIEVVVRVEQNLVV